MSRKVADGLRQIQQQGQQFELSPLSRLHRIDGLYQQTLSRFQPRVIVQGDPSVLSQGDNTSRIRALLFAGVRAAVLWRQRGGSRWSLIFHRRRYVIEAQRRIDRLTA
jgi:high frequency lysogenization protein